LAKTFVVDEVKAEELPIRYNVAPTQPVYAVAESRGERPRRLLGTFRWGLVPSWAKDPSIGNKMINARAESVATKNAYKRALATRRCIIPADAFYEWQKVSGETAKGKATIRKVPYVIQRRDGEPLAFAGLWEVWHSPADPDGEPLRSCVIITTQANELLAPIHDRMPVVLPPEAWASWLDPTNTDIEQVQRLLVPAPAGDLEAWPVSNRVSNAANEGPDLIEPLEQADAG
jgi:putative SOS response-associated peptidase YedK